VVPLVLGSVIRLEAILHCLSDVEGHMAPPKLCWKNPFAGVAHPSSPALDSQKWGLESTCESGLPGWSNSAAQVMK
jgi:hypothetical protein